MKHASVKVYAKSCNECLFSDKRVVSAERAQELIDKALKTDGFFVCHKSTMRDEIVCCRAFYEKHRRDTAALRIAEALGGLEFVPLPKDNK